MQCFDELGGSRVLCNHVDDGFRIAPRSCSGHGFRAASRRFEQTTLAELAQFAEHGTAAGRPRSTPARRRSGASRRQLQPTGESDGWLN